MVGQFSPHDIWRYGTPTHLPVSSASGAAASTGAFGTQTYAIRVDFPQALSSTAGARIKIGNNVVVSSTADAILPPNWVEYLQVRPGEQLSAISNDSTAGIVNVTELTT